MRVSLSCVRVQEAVTLKVRRNATWQLFAGLRARCDIVFASSGGAAASAPPPLYVAAVSAPLPVWVRSRQVRRPIGTVHHASPTHAHLRSRPPIGGRATCAAGEPASPRPQRGSDEDRRIGTRVGGKESTRGVLQSTTRTLRPHFPLFPSDHLFLFAPTTLPLLPLPTVNPLLLAPSSSSSSSFGFLLFSRRLDRHRSSYTRRLR